MSFAATTNSRNGGWSLLLTRYHLRVLPLLTTPSIFFDRRFWKNTAWFGLVKNRIQTVKFTSMIRCQALNFLFRKCGVNVRLLVSYHHPGFTYFCVDISPMQWSSCILVLFSSWFNDRGWWWLWFLGRLWPHLKEHSRLKCRCRWRDWWSS